MRCIRQTMRKKQDDKKDYYVYFGGAKINRKEANRVGIGILFGVLGIILVTLLSINQRSLMSYIIIGISMFVGYFIVGSKLFK